MINTLNRSDLSLATLNTPDLATLSPEIVALIADFFKVLSESSRLQIICSLKNGQKNVSQIIESTGLGQANVSKHLKVLTQAGIVHRTQQGVNVLYAIANPLIFPLCDLVCNSLVSQLQQQQDQINSLKSLQNRL